MDFKETKLAFIEALFNRGVWTKAVQGQSEYRTRCPFCGDSTTNANVGKLYLKVNPEENDSIVYHCFRCEEAGIVTSDTLDSLGINDESLKEGIEELNKKAPKSFTKKKQDLSEYKIFDYVLPSVSYIDTNKIKYVEDRLGITMSDSMIRDTKIITSLRDFLVINNINYTMMPNYMCRELDKNFIGFLSHGSSYILFRKVWGDFKATWIKYPVARSSVGCKVFYSIDSNNTIDYKDTSKSININMAEGVMDILSAKYVLGMHQDNSINVAVTGKYYDPIIRYIISLGIIGDHVRLNIFSDNDEKFGNPNFQTSLKGYKTILKPVMGAFGSTFIYYNLKGKDIGVSKDNIFLSKDKIG